MKNASVSNERNTAVNCSRADVFCPDFEKTLGKFEYHPAKEDPRNVRIGNIIPAEHYADQPYIVATGDGGWLCVVTTGAGHEGSRGQHIIVLRSDDYGKHWSEPVAIEPSDGPEASWGVPLVTESGRIFVFYIYNADDIRILPADNPPFGDGTTKRMDSHGYYCFRWSDDHGRTWSSQRVIIPVRDFEIDRKNPTMGQVRLFWNVGRPLISKGAVFLTLHKVGGFGAGWFTQSEGAFLRSDNLLTQNNPAKAAWETLPYGEFGLRTPTGGGPIAEEQSLIELSDGSFFVVYRSIDGHPVGSYSRDRGRVWQQPEYLQYANGGYLKHPRAACFAWKLNCGGYVLWFHNHGGAVLGRHPERRDKGYDDRNPVWMCRGWETETSQGLEVVWSNPEIVLYDDDPCIRMSYPDLREEEDIIYLTETQKAVARVHELSPGLARALRFGPEVFDAGEMRREAALDWTVDSGRLYLPSLPALLARSPESPYGTTDQRAGFTLELEIANATLLNSGVFVEAWHSSYGGFRLEWLEEGSLKLTCSDGRGEFSWDSDPGLLNDGLRHHIVACVDGGPKVLSFMIDGKLCDGGTHRQFGWSRFSPLFRGLPTGLPLVFTSSGAASVGYLRIYPRALFFAEAESLFLAADEGPGASSGLTWDFTENPDLSETSSKSNALGATP